MSNAPIEKPLAFLDRLSDEGLLTAPEKGAVFASVNTCAAFEARDAAIASAAYLRALDDVERKLENVYPHAKGRTLDAVAELRAAATKQPEPVKL